DRLKQLAPKIGIAKPTMACLRKGRVVRHVAVQTKTAEPAIGQVQVDFLAQPPFRANAKAVAHDQHADQQLGINRRPPRFTVVGRQVCPNAIEFDKAVDRPQQMRLGYVTFERELVEQSVLLDFPIPHHRLPPSRRDFSKSDYYTKAD